MYQKFDVYFDGKDVYIQIKYKLPSDGLSALLF